MDKLKMFFLEYKLFDIFLVIALIGEVFEVSTLNVSQILWYNLIFILIGGSIFCYEHAKIAYDPETQSFKTYRNLAKLFFIVLLAILAFEGIQVQSLY